VNPVCPYCGEESKQVTGITLYPHLEQFAEKIFYHCKPCDSRVGCHPGTDKPLGTLANNDLRLRRNYAHKHFDRLWKEGYMKSRIHSYLWLAIAMDIPPKFCHIGHFNEEQCLEVARLSKAKLLEILND